MRIELMVELTVNYGEEAARSTVLMSSIWCN